MFFEDNVENEEPRRIGPEISPQGPHGSLRKIIPEDLEREICLSSADWDNELVRRKIFCQKRSCLQKNRRILKQTPW